MTEAASPSRTTSHLLSLDDPEGVAALRGVFRKADFSETEIRAVCGSEGVGVIPRADLPYILRRLPNEGTLPTLIRLFMLGVPVGRDAVLRDLAPMTPERLESLGLVRLTGDTLVSRVKVLPFSPFILIGDPHYQDPLAVPADYVIGVNQTSVNLVALTVRKPAKAALDIGTGCGVVSLHASQFSGRVVSTDINPRALNFTNFNAMLNGVKNIETRLGSLFEPVGNESFDLIVSNPPYVISPDSDFQYRDSGRDGHSLCRTLVRELPAHLNEGGFASVLSNWTVKPGQQWTDPVNEWIRDSGCDTLLLHTTTEEPLKYALNWNRPLLPERPREYEETVDRWDGYFRKSGIAGISMGGLVMRKRKAASNWTAAENLPVQGDIGTSDQILRIFEAHDWLAGSPDLASAAFKPVEDLRFEQSVVIKDGGMSIQDVRFSLAHGFKMEGLLDPRTMVTLGHCNGQRTLGEILDRIGPPGNVEFRNHVVDSVRRLFGLGYIVRSPITG